MVAPDARAEFVERAPLDRQGRAREDDAGGNAIAVDSSIARCWSAACDGLRDTARLSGGKTW
jgi:hypothetical protein